MSAPCICGPPSPGFPGTSGSEGTPRSSDTNPSRAVRLLGLLVLAGALLTTTGADPVRAQSPAPVPAAADTVSNAHEPRLGVGAHAGWPTGLGLLFERAGTDLGLLAAWRLESFFFGHAHLRLWEGPTPIAPTVGYYGGPGVSVHARAGQFRVGASGLVGARYRYDPFEFFLQLAPRLEVVPELRFGIAIGTGFYVWI